MSCKCQEKQIATERLETPCQDPGDEAFRIAYRDHLQKNTQLHAQVKAMEHLVEATKASAVKHIKMVDAHAGKVEEYLRQLWNTMSDLRRLEFEENHGKPPIQIRIQ